MFAQEADADAIDTLFCLTSVFRTFIRETSHGIGDLSVAH
jgi:hypothetical protein